MEKSKVHDRRSVKLEQVTRSDYIPFMGGRPERTTVVRKEDVLNLVIALNTAQNMDDFLARV